MKKYNSTSSFPVLFICLSFILFKFNLKAQVVTDLEEGNNKDIKLVLVEDSNVNPGETRLNFPLFIDHGKGYRIRCENQGDEEKVIRSLGFILAPSVILDPLSPEVLMTELERQPLLCPFSDRYPVKAFRFTYGDGEKVFLNFPLTFGPNPQYGPELYVVGCSELINGLNLDPEKVIQADPTPFWNPGHIFKINCLRGTPLNAQPKNFRDWCIKKDLSAEQRNTVAAILSTTPQAGHSLGDHVACQEASHFLEGISYLSLKERGISNLEPLSSLKKITELVLSGNPISELGPLKNLTGLLHLNLKNCKVKNITPLLGLTQLQTLDLSGNLIDQVPRLDSLHLLENLNLAHNLLETRDDLYHVSLAKNLKTLNLDQNKIKDVGSIDLFSSTVKVTALNNPFVREKFQIWCRHFFSNVFLNEEQKSTVKKIILELSPNQNLSILRGDQVDPFCEDMERMTFNIRELNLGCYEENCTPIQDISPLKGGNPPNSLNFLKLRQLNLYNNLISDVTPLKSLKDLESLDLGGNNIRDISPLKELNNLRTLSLWFNQIHDITVFGLPEKLKQLVELDLSFNAIRNALPLGELPKLKKLSVSNNKIESSEFVEGVPLLEHLDLSGNPLHDGEFLRSLSDLKKVNLMLTPLENFSWMQDLTLLIYADIRGTKGKIPPNLRNRISEPAISINEVFAFDQAAIRKMRGLGLADLLFLEIAGTPYCASNADGEVAAAWACGLVQ